MGRRGPPDVPDVPVKELDWTKSIKPKNELALTYRDSAKPLSKKMKPRRPWGKAIFAGLVGLGLWPMALVVGAFIGIFLYPVVLALSVGNRPVEETLKELRDVADKAQTILFLPAVMFFNQLNHELIEVPLSTEEEIENSSLQLNSEESNVDQVSTPKLGVFDNTYFLIKQKKG